jgi:HK97 family phage major capsid protein
MNRLLMMAEQRHDLARKARTLNRAARGRRFTSEEDRTFEGLSDSIAGLDDLILAERKRQASPPLENYGYRNLGEQIAEIVTATRTGDWSQIQQRTATGVGMNDPASGGFLIAPVFAETLLGRTYGGALLSRATVVEFEKGKETHFPTPDETSRAAGSRWGGIRVTWADEGVSIPTSFPKFRSVGPTLHGAKAAISVTNELLSDAPMLTAVLERGYTSELRFEVEDAMVNGKGLGLPLGIIGAPGTISVAAEGGQAPATILRENLKKMWARFWTQSKTDGEPVWLVSADAEVAIGETYQAIGTAGTGTQVYIPAGLVDRFARLYGAPVIPTEYNAALGTVGDVVLCDPAEYLIVQQPLRRAISAHCSFTTDETVLRFVLNCDGQPVWQSPITPKNGGATQSPFVTLAARP